MPLKYGAYVAVICAVLLDLYAANPDTGAYARFLLDGTALMFAIGGLCTLAGAQRLTRR